MFFTTEVKMIKRTPKYVRENPELYPEWIKQHRAARCSMHKNWRAANPERVRALARKAAAKFHKTDKGKVAHLKHRQTEKYKATRRRYKKTETCKAIDKNTGMLATAG